MIQVRETHSSIRRFTLILISSCLVISTVISSIIFKLDANAADTLEYPPTLEIFDITEKRASFKVDLDDREPRNTEIVSANISVSRFGEEVWFDTMNFAYPADVSDTKITSYDTFFPGREYTVKLEIVDQSSTVIDTLTTTFLTAGALVNSHIQSVSFEDYDDTQRAMVISGQDFEVANNYYAAFAGSLVALNDEALPFCTHNIGINADQFRAFYPGAPYDAVSDDAPCYLFYDLGASPAVKEDELTILLPNGFDEEAYGTVTIKNVPSFAFNQGNQPIEDTVTVNEDATPLEDGAIIANKPTFSGVAPAGSTVTVTVRSDPVTCTTVADSNGNWECTLPSNLPGGAHRVFVQVTTLGGDVIELGPYDVTVAQLSGVLPPNTGIQPKNALYWALI